MSGYLVVLAFLALFMLGFPVVLAIGIPSVTYLLLNDLPLQMMAQRTLYALGVSGGIFVACTKPHVHAELTAAEAHVQ